MRACLGPLKGAQDREEASREALRVAADVIEGIESLDFVFVRARGAVTEQKLAKLEFERRWTHFMLEGWCFNMVRGWPVGRPILPIRSDK